MNIAKLDHRIEVIRLSPSGEMDEDGFERAASEEVVLSCWAQVSETSGKELIESGAEFSEAKKRFLIRYTPTVLDTDMFIRYDGKDYNIVLINTYGDNHRFTEIWTEWRERV